MANCTGAIPTSFQNYDVNKPPRNRGAYRQMDHDPYKVHKKLSNSDEFDNHTLATASTSAATSSYSMTDDVSEASDIGMEDLTSPRNFAVDVTPYTGHSFTAGKETFTIDTRYNMIRTIGTGAYGTVISASDSKQDRKVAIKMIPRAFNDEIDAKRILREIKLMKHFQHENIVGILDMMPPHAKFVEDFNDVYIVGELMETDLHRIIYSKQPLSIDHVQYFVYQILRGMKYIHSANVIHRDLKPSNLLVNANCDLKICDFGLARGIPGEHEHDRLETMALTEYVVTRWYRAPEIMLACHAYSKPVDVWSIGCIFAELILRKPYFPGNDYIDQLNIISDKLGKLAEEDMDFITSEKAKRFLRKLPDKSPATFRQQFPETPRDALDVLRKMLHIHPKKRITIDQALAHPFFAQLSSPSDEPVAAESFDFTFENEKLHRSRLKELIWQECGDFRPSCMPIAPRRELDLHEA